MRDQEKTKQQLIQENEALRRRLSQLEGGEQQRKRAEEALRVTEQRLSLHFQQTPLAAIEWDVEGRVRKWNPGAVRIFGHSETEALGRDVSFILPPHVYEHVDRVRDALRNRTGGERSTNENITKDGQIIFCEWYNTPLVNAEGQVIGAVSLAQDITENRRAEEALRQAHSELEQRVRERTAELTTANEGLTREIEARTQMQEALREEEAKYRTLVETCPDTVVLADLQGNVTFVSPRMLELHGSDSIDYFIGRQPLEFIVPEDQQRFQEDFKRAVMEGVSKGQEYTFIRNDGSRFPAEVSGAVIRDNAGQPTGVVAVLRDITERRYAQDALQRSEERFRSYFVQGLLGMAVTGADMRWIEVNDRLCRILGYSREELLRMKWTDATHPNDLDSGLLHFHRLVAGEIDHYTHDKRFVRKTGETVYATVFIRCFRRDDGAIDHVLALVEDVTDRRRAQEDLEREHRVLKHLLQSSDHERQMIAYEIHDGLAQQLAGAVMQFEAYGHHKDREPKLAAEAFHAGITMLRQSLVEARGLISGVRPPILDESGIVAAVAHLVNEERHKKGPKIEYLSDVEFERLTPLLENAIYRIVQEGLANACRHSQSEKVRVALVQQGDRVRIEVQDYGVGFKSNAIDDGHFGVAGIRERARLLGGSAVIDSEVGVGTWIVVELPIVLRSDEDE